MSIEDSSERAEIPLASLRRIDSLLERYGLERLGPPVPVPDSVLSENYRVETEAGPRFCRMHKKTRTRERIEAEYALQEWAGAHGIPVVPPLVDADGQQLHRVDGVFVSLFPWIEGRTISAESATLDEARRLGEVHGRVAGVVAGYESAWLEASRRWPSWNTDASIQALSRVDDLIRYYPAPPPDQVRVQERIRFQLGWLQRGEAKPVGAFAALHRQACFGDFHNRQVIFRDDGSVAAVVDWEGLGFMPPTLELVRALCVSDMLPPARLAAYVGGYGNHARIRGEEARLAVEAWWQFMLHDTWSLTTRFVQGDRRPERFFESEFRNLRLFSDRGYRRTLAESLRAAARAFEA